MRRGSGAIQHGMWWPPAHIWTGCFFRVATCRRKGCGPAQGVGNEQQSCQRKRIGLSWCRGVVLVTVALVVVVGVGAILRHATVLGSRAVGQRECRRRAHSVVQHVAARSLHTAATCSRHPARKASVGRPPPAIQLQWTPSGQAASPAPASAAGMQIQHGRHFVPVHRVHLPPQHLPPRFTCLMWALPRRWLPRYSS